MNFIQLRSVGCVALRQMHNVRHTFVHTLHASTILDTAIAAAAPLDTALSSLPHSRKGFVCNLIQYITLTYKVGKQKDVIARDLNVT